MVNVYSTVALTEAEISMIHKDTQRDFETNWGKTIKLETKTKCPRCHTHITIDMARASYSMFCQTNGCFNETCRGI